MEFNNKPIFGMIHMYGQERAVDYADIVKFHLEIEGEKFTFPTKSGAIENGIRAKKLVNDVRLIKGVRYWYGATKGTMKQVSYNEFDMSFLLI